MFQNLDFMQDFILKFKFCFRFQCWVLPKPVKLFVYRQPIHNIFPVVVTFLFCIDHNQIILPYNSCNSICQCSSNFSNQHLQFHGIIVKKTWESFQQNLRNSPQVSCLSEPEKSSPFPPLISLELLKQYNPKLKRSREGNLDCTSSDQLINVISRDEALSTASIMKLAKAQSWKKVQKSSSEPAASTTTDWCDVWHLLFYSF